MPWFVLGFALGVFALQQQREILWNGQLFMGCSLLLWPIWGWVRYKAGRVHDRSLYAVHLLLLILIGVISGFGWASWRAQQRLFEQLPPALEGVDQRVTGVVSGLPERFERGWRFGFTVDSRTEAIPRQLMLTWYQSRRPSSAHDGLGALEDGEADMEASDWPHPVRAGERWQLTVRLKRPHGAMNPYGFDYEAWLLQKQIRATGYVRRSSENQRLDNTPSRLMDWVGRWRENIRARHERILGDTPEQALISALAVGDQRGIASSSWDVFARTGVTHLMSISGLHVTMMGAMAYAICFALWRRSSVLPLRLPAQKAAVLAGFLAAFAYALLAGFEIPAQRTLYMLGVAALAVWLGRATQGRAVLALALFVVLLLDPWAVLSAGFWLSFGAVGLLFYISAGRLARARPINEWGRAQWAMTIGMIPALLALFGQFSLISPIANAVAIPLVSFMITPLALIGSLPDELGLLSRLPLEASAWLGHILLIFLQKLSTLPGAVWQQHALPLWSVVLALCGMAWMYLPRGFPGRWLGLCACIPLFLNVPERPAPGAAKITVLDVGHGLAVHIQTVGHDMLFDTGPAYSPTANAGNRVIVPYLRALGVRRLDTVLLSHADKDHAGGSSSLLAQIPTGVLAQSFVHEDRGLWPEMHRVTCAQDWKWTWDHVDFEVLYPPMSLLYAAQAGQRISSNHRSCVLSVRAGGRSMLLTADIETPDESHLLKEKSLAFPVDIMTAPHHGSASSSSEAFVRVARPSWVIYTVGYRNRFGHPKPDVVERYRDVGAKALRSDDDGAVIVDLDAEGVRIAVQREAARRYWHDMRTAGSDNHTNP
jgi:competence protein ComEC